MVEEESRDRKWSEKVVKDVEREWSKKVEICGRKWRENRVRKWKEKVK